MKLKVNEVVKECLSEMFSRVGRVYCYEDHPLKDNWWATSTWTEEEEADFKVWMIAHLRKRLRWTKRTAEKEFSYFNLMCGWKVREAV